MNRFAWLLALALLGCWASAVNAAQIYFTREGAHTELVFSTGQLAEWPTMAEGFPDASHVGIGWGDLAYYGEGQKGARRAAAALFFPTRSAIRARPLTPAAGWISIEVSDQQLSDVLAFVRGTVEQGTVIRSTPNVELTMTANGRYSGLRNCNNWTAHALQAGDIKISRWRSHTPGSVRRQLLQKANRDRVEIRGEN